ncbi:hypothetical protein [Liquorilactobacillus uvarum]|uniref:SnoaL-like domain-containing protein n=1 Tax=Liquorilactobacillus uvarum DSM 19971 TaxID=1423812 RepID=A0A0R1PVQ9_9LACO|nr:hypothetical protein [Liquorilactobacillus uvarum]KRL36663.1 hypothetical protein FD20_GL001126 [Liquorilactobacillus uvarum DSM 19971]
MNKKQIKDIIEETYDDVLNNLRVDKIKQYFDTTYTQTTDLKTSNYDEFVGHIKTLKRITTSISVPRFNEFIIDEDQGQAFLHYLVLITKKDGTKGTVEVFAVFTLRKNKIIRCEEITQTIDNENLANMGSVNE